MKKKAFGGIYSALIFFFLYMPIAVLILFSFNSSNSTSTFEGFSLKWYRELFNDAATLDALKNLGYKPAELKKIIPILETNNSLSISELIKLALKNIY